MSKFTKGLKQFIDGDFTLTTKSKKKEPRRPSTHVEPTIKDRFDVWHDEKAPAFFKGVYVSLSVFTCLFMIFMLVTTVSFLPPYGDPTNPTNNEVSQRYLEKGVEETGAINIVAGVILDYRAFDTFGESAVLFAAAISVMMLLKKDKKEALEAHLSSENFQPKRDLVVKNIAKFIIPFLIMFGVYLILNGHLSPGGGFSGGAIIGASMILYSSAFGYKKISKIITEKFTKNVTFCSLAFYAVAKGYSFFTGANHIETGIPLGVAGNIISSGLILPLNICVGLIVSCTMYSFYSLFSKGEI